MTILIPILIMPWLAVTTAAATFTVTNPKGSGPGINLAFAGTAPNDNGDEDNRANQLQNYPIITNAAVSVTTTTLQGVFNSRSSTTYALDFYGHMECDPSGSRKGEYHLGKAMVTTDAGGNTHFTVNFITTSFWRRTFTAQATDPGGNTSDFSPCWTVPIPGWTFVVVNTNDVGPGSLRQAMMDASANNGPSHIVFNIPGPGLHVIRPHSGLSMDINESTVIDGFTQPGASPNTLSDGNNAVWAIEFDGSLSDGLRLPRISALRGLRITNCPRVGVNVREDSVIAGCFIYNNLSDGIDFDDDSYEVLIGGTAPADRNVISGNLASGIVTDGSGLLRVLGNWIGTDVTGTGAFGNRGDGILLRYIGNSWIGGLNPGEANVIAFNEGAGIKVNDSGARIRGNRIFANGSPGIDLLYWNGDHFVNGVSTNDPGDADLGANQLQNYPIITNAVFTATGTTIHGQLHSASHSTYALDFYANTEASTTGHGPGEHYVGSIDVTTDNAGNADFTAAFNIPLRGHYLTATATSHDQNTSEFSPAWPQPLRFEFTHHSGLNLRNADNSPITGDRLAKISVTTTTNLVPPAVWLPLPNPLELIDGRIRVLGPVPAKDTRFFRAVEAQ